MYNGGTWYCSFFHVSSTWNFPGVFFMENKFFIHDFSLCFAHTKIMRLEYVKELVTHLYAIKFYYLFFALSHAAISWIFNARNERESSFNFIIKVKLITKAFNVAFFTFRIVVRVVERKGHLLWLKWIFYELRRNV